MRALGPVAGLLVVIAGCDSGRGARVDASADARVASDAAFDAHADTATSAAMDTGMVMDTGASTDTGATTDAASGTDAGAGSDAHAVTDAGQDAALATTDAGHDAAAIADSGHDAASSGGCISGAVGTRAVRFRWRGSSPGSTAYVDYELNQLPDTSRWHVSAASTSFSYTPIFDDTFLGEGGLDLEGTAFIDVELSTSGLASVSRATLAIYGRSFNTTASGSFHWRTFHGTGSAPTNLVANSAPYAWYLADATTELVAGDSGTLLRIYPGPNSDALIVDRVEICFAE